MKAVLGTACFENLFRIQNFGQSTLDVTFGDTCINFDPNEMVSQVDQESFDSEHLDVEFGYYQPNYSFMCESIPGENCEYSVETLLDRLEADEDSIFTDGTFS